MVVGQTVLITGGTGFVGAHAARALLEGGASVVSMDVSADTRRLEKLGVLDRVDRVHGDIGDGPSVGHVVGEWEPSVILHLGAVGHPPPSPRAAVRTNIQGTENVFEAARRFDGVVERVVWTSSTGVYAPPSRYDATSEGGVDETALVGPETLYGAAKYFAERLARAYRDAYELSLVGLRPTLVYGPFDEVQLLEDPGEVDDHTTQLAQLFVNPALGSPHSMGYGTERLDWLYVDDLIDALLGAARVEAAALTRSVYNVGSGHWATVRQVAATIRAVLDGADLTISDDGTLPWNTLVDCSAARADFDFDPVVDLEAGIRSYVNAIRSDQGLTPV